MSVKKAYYAVRVLVIIIIMLLMKMILIRPREVL